MTKEVLLLLLWRLTHETEIEKNNNFRNKRRRMIHDFHDEKGGRNGEKRCGAIEAFANINMRHSPPNVCVFLLRLLRSTQCVENSRPVAQNGSDQLLKYRQPVSTEPSLFMKPPS